MGLLDFRLLTNYWPKEDQEFHLRTARNTINNKEIFIGPAFLNNRRLEEANAVYIEK